jgi:hypothetical protein
MISLDDKIRCIARELALRRNVYPKWIAAGRMKQEAADREIAVMAAVLADLERERAVDKGMPSAPPDGSAELG